MGQIAHRSARLRVTTHPVACLRQLRLLHRLPFTRGFLMEILAVPAAVLWLLLTSAFAGAWPYAVLDFRITASGGPVAGCNKWWTTQLAFSAHGTPLAEPVSLHPPVKVAVILNGFSSNGEKILADAFRRELAVFAVIITNDRRHADYIVDGSIAAGQIKEEKQPIRIEWLVRHSAGHVMGLVVQTNEISPGSL